MSFSIAAASVLAKVHRDRLLVELDSAFPGYGLAQHKGYCCPAHLPPSRGWTNAAAPEKLSPGGAGCAAIPRSLNAPLAGMASRQLTTSCYRLCLVLRRRQRGSSRCAGFSHRATRRRRPHRAEP